MMHESGQSDGPVVPEKLPNNVQGGAAEAVEEKGIGQGERGQRNTPRTQSRARCVKWAGPRAPGSKEGQGRTVHRVAASRRCRSLAGGLSGVEPEGRHGGRWCELGGVRTGTRGQPLRPARTPPQRRLPGEAVSQGVHTEGRRAPACARGRRAGGQDPPAGAGRGAERRLRVRLPRFLLRVPARTQPA